MSEQRPGVDEAVTAAVERAAGGDADGGAREVTVQIEDNRKPVRVELATPGVSVEIEAPDALDVVAAKALALWREIQAAPPPPERFFGYGASGNGSHDLIATDTGIDTDEPEEVDRGDLPRVPRRARPHSRQRGHATRPAQEG